MAKSALHLRLNQLLMPNEINPNTEENLSLSHEAQDRPLCFAFSQESLGLAGSRLSHSLGHWFRSDGIRQVDFISIDPACYQSLSLCREWEASPL